MPRTKKYDTIQDVILDLSSESNTRKGVMQTRYRAEKKGDSDYATMIMSGVLAYDRLNKIATSKANYNLPEDFLNSMEIAEGVGWRCKED